MSVLLETNAGNLVIDLFVNSAPTESRTFIALCLSKFYHYSPFVNVRKNVAVDSGNPHFPDPIVAPQPDKFIDFTPSSNFNPGKLGEVLFTSNGDKFGPEFFISLGPATDKCGYVFGTIGEGFTTLEYINNCVLDEAGRPLKDVRILHTFVLDDPFSLLFEAPPSPYPTQKQIDSFRLLVDESALEDIKAESHALTLEVLGDLPSAKIQPSEKVLFICKLNPVTTEDDLRLIFQRFGQITSVEVIRDRVTGHSLCYGFIEFTNKSAVERAYRKMEGAIIDDRKVHVDFSQSTKRKRNRNDST
ncbi:hypothetical protein KL930_002905 [Ogataea haglerorum]|uniref:uncharacterized protein n=1 Tax=Ogataea haglerorum TaxID=1937702 RepID=UPI001C8AAF09|nr:uncharacterized protein KL911_002838 [Ogataea haglerorum]KAG7694832.1 hypothetical protein KL951_004009 [Ogataea haglerorum]KAG7719060.1 hypothetical protein KL913_002058 [Ogataea haglerorum]KAG7720115.1 hypothetical protein KL949_002080 [Ogataea haglerorum]KAG7738485.1 hypothetical protein KL923_003182 [Ogataea haglerorum]KAG7747717.1 hypothetical protein KL912_003089 [Ogataea haglerorum]